jgi:hypothetical protein
MASKNNSKTKSVQARAAELKAQKEENVIVETRVVEEAPKYTGQVRADSIKAGVLDNWTEKLLTSEELLSKYFIQISFTGWRAHTSKSGKNGFMGEIRFEGIGRVGIITLWKNSEGRVSLMPSSRWSKKEEKMVPFNGMDGGSFNKAIGDLGDDYFDVHEDAWAFATKIRRSL